MNFKHASVFLLTALFGAAQSSQAQSNFQPGSVVSLDGKEQTGLIDYREWRVNPRKISFIKTLGGETLAFSVAELASFKVDGKDSFTRAVVTKDMAPVEQQEVIDGSPGETVTDTVFLRILTKGHAVELYELYDTKPHFYIREKDGDYQELTYKVSYNANTSNLEYKYTYRNQLQKFAFGHSDENRLLGYLATINYNERDLMKVVAAINKVKVERKKGSLINYFAAAGPVMTTLKTTGTTDLADFDFKTNTGFTIGAGIDFASSRNLQDLLIRFELFYTSTKYEGSGKLTDYLPEGAIGTYTLKHNNLTPSLSLLYSFVRAPKFKLYAGLGVDYNFSSYSDNTYRLKWINYDKENERENYLKLEKNWMSVSARIGAIIGNKLEIGLVGKVAGSFENMMLINAKPTIYGLRVGYRFKRNI
ncbi:hypothetical protein [Paraflavitalea pollutisoli]|uniref:hypothetical protein n=1 Tax=Paraflavitalea pollutisoli TaxID=3034143 RepID=UPI0023EA7D6A|nr:hypothetical protein [Paraflavitalea sp. H1-2-19X]